MERGRVVWLPGSARSGLRPAGSLGVRRLCSRHVMVFPRDPERQGDGGEPSLAGEDRADL